MKKSWIDHILRGENLLREVIQGRTIEKDQGEENDWVYELASYAELKRKALNRKECIRWKKRTCLLNGRTLSTKVRIHASKLQLRPLGQHCTTVRGHPFMTSTKKSGFSFDPLCPHASICARPPPPCGRPHAVDRKSLEMASTMTVWT